jgi:acetyl esterase
LVDIKVLPLGGAVMRLDPLQEAQFRQEGSLQAPKLDELPLAEALAILRPKKPPYAPPQGEAALVEDRTIPGLQGHPIPVRIYRPADSGVYNVLLHLHGGGWVGGSIGNDDARCHATSRRANIVVLSVDYRLAPEHKFPAGLEDAYAVLLWLRAHGGEIGVNPEGIGISGSSAGGNLAAAATLLARERNGPNIKCQILAYPICDTGMFQPSYAENAEGPLLTARMMAWFLPQYLPEGTNRRDPLIAPLHAADLRRLPPALILTGGCDPLRDEGMEYGAKLRAAGVPATSTCYPGMAHGFVTRSPDHPQSQAAMRQIIEMLARWLPA